MKLLTSQKNELFDLIEATGYFFPSQFDLREISQGDGEYITEVRLRDSSFFFRLIPESSVQGLFFANFSPGEKSVVEATDILDWHSGVLCIDEWLSFLRRELSSQNKWEDLFQQVVKVHLSPSDGRSKFTYLEYVDLSEKMDKIISSLDSIPLLAEHQTLITSQLNHLTELAKELDKVDWKNLFVGTIVSIITQLYITKENASRLWTLIKSIFSNFFLP